MLKSVMVISLILIANLCIFAQRVPLPANYTVLDSAYGDLDKDGSRELVVAYNTKEEDDLGESIPRELIIYKMKGGSWTTWKKSQQALYGSRDGGMMGDPFGGIKINNGVLSISHNGGSSWKWGHTDKYRFQNGEFYLIGYTSEYGKLCEYWTQVDFNLVTGKLFIQKEYEECEKSEQTVYKRENETVSNKTIRITIQNRNKEEVKIVTPKYKHQIYIATKFE